MPCGQHRRPEVVDVVGDEGRLNTTPASTAADTGKRPFSELSAL